ncbi:hypothetical protein JAB6_35510 [Janthinobacterium sp. HH104]|uniref:glycosyltransferase family 4 protein n=1 Tax=Janthinobacterium sp. HH104 TaxID=1537276 RepID=UPI000893C145|nr:glycosyltransferase family 4 protein [Janthinobacterium sp. HH104]OEZ81962.1 hypothetical protein JAB6_35510 [Janthinobacterium sp. HH104]
MIQIILSQAGGYQDVVAYLQQQGAHVSNMGPERGRGSSFRGKLSILAAMVSPKLWGVRKLWGSDDIVLLIGWQALPILAMIRCGLVKRPRKLLVMACFVHSVRARRGLNLLWRALRFPGMGFIAFSKGEGDNLIQAVGMAPQDVYFHLWRQELYGFGGAAAAVEGDYVFAGGYSNRDYDLLLQAMAGVSAPLVVVAAERNHVAVPAQSRMTLHLDLPEAQFESLLAASRVVAMPLKSQGEACGQSVLLRVLRNRKPLVATRHEAIEAYLGSDYPGFVPHDDVEAMRATLERAVEDATFRKALSDAIMQAESRLAKVGSPGEEIHRFLLS